VLGSAVVQRAVTDLIDVQAVIGLTPAAAA